MLIVSGCSTKEVIKENNAEERVVSAVKDTNNKNVYEDFLTDFQNNNENSIDIDNFIKKYVENTSNINEISYTVEKIKFLSTVQDELLIKIDMGYELDFRDIIGIFDENNEEIFSQGGLMISYEIVDALDNGKQQLVLITDDSGNGHTLENMQIISFDEKTQDTAIVFNEVLRAYAYLPHKEVKDSDFYTVSFENSYKFSASAHGAKNIVFKSEIFEREDEILLTGMSTFEFNGEKYVSQNYYDYRGKAEEIYNSKE